MFSGPRLLALVDVGSYPSPAADGRLWKYCTSGLPSASVNDWPISLEPTTVPFAALTSDPFGLVLQAGNLGDAGDDQRVGDPEDDGEDDQRPEGGQVLAQPARKR